jgi:hypothetical protein
MQNNATDNTNVAVATAAVTKNAPRHVELKFNVIVTFAMKRDVLQKLDGVQAMFDLEYIVGARDSYDAVMRSVLGRTFQTVEELLGLKTHDIVKISTAGTWRAWEKISGKSWENCRKRSKVSKDGKFYF